MIRALLTIAILLMVAILALPTLREWTYDNSPPRIYSEIVPVHRIVAPGGGLEIQHVVDVRPACSGSWQGRIMSADGKIDTVLAAGTATWRVDSTGGQKSYPFTYPIPSYVPPGDYLFYLVASHTCEGASRMLHYDTRQPEAWAGGIVRPVSFRVQ